MMPSYESFCNASRFFVEMKDDDGELGKIPVSLIRAVVIVSIPCLNGQVSKVAFMKTNRGQTFRDSRSPKKNITGQECLAELQRMLQSNSEGELAFQTLNV